MTFCEQGLTLSEGAQKVWDSAVAQLGTESYKVDWEVVVAATMSVGFTVEGTTIVSQDGKETFDKGYTLSPVFSLQENQVVKTLSASGTSGEGDFYHATKTVAATVATHLGIQLECFFPLSEPLVCIPQPGGLTIGGDYGSTWFVNVLYTKEEARKLVEEYVPRLNAFLATL